VCRLAASAAESGLAFVRLAGSRFLKLTCAARSVALCTGLPHDVEETPTPLKNLVICTDSLMLFRPLVREGRL
jgi:hypothetical protein